MHFCIQSFVFLQDFLLGKCKRLMLIFHSLLGISGGMIIGPLLLEMDVLSQVTAATSMFMVLFTAR